MLIDNLRNRFTAKWWEPTPLENEKLQLILECAYLAPSKQGHYDYEIHVITDSVIGKEFKEWLYWDNTACLNKIRGAQGAGLRRYNGQVMAPVVIMWLGKKFENLNNAYQETNWVRTNNDCIVSATMALCQAEELGVSTGFCGCLGGDEIATRLNRPNYTAIISVGFGYAVADNIKLRKVYDKQGIERGFDLSNVSPSIRDIDSRKNRLPKESLINYI
jgi:nitroreductase